jgi:hypothetical protein
MGPALTGAVLVLGLLLGVQGAWAAGFGVQDNKVTITTNSASYPATVDQSGVAAGIDAMQGTSLQSLQISLRKDGVSDGTYSADLGVIVDDADNSRRIEAYLPGVQAAVSGSDTTVTIPAGKNLRLAGRSTDGLTTFATTLINAQTDGPVTAVNNTITFSLTNLQNKVQSKFGAASGNASILNNILAAGRYSYTVLVKSTSVPVGWETATDTVDPFDSYNIGPSSTQYGLNLAQLSDSPIANSSYLNGTCYVIRGSYGVGTGNTAPGAGPLPTRNSVAAGGGVGAPAPEEPEVPEIPTEQQEAFDDALAAGDADALVEAAEAIAASLADEDPQDAAEALDDLAADVLAEGFDMLDEFLAVEGVRNIIQAAGGLDLTDELSVSTTLGTLVNPQRTGGAVRSDLTVVFGEGQVTVSSDPETGMMFVQVGNTQYPLTNSNVQVLADPPDETEITSSNGLTLEIRARSGLAYVLVPGVADISTLIATAQSGGAVVTVDGTMGSLTMTGTDGNTYSGLFDLGSLAGGDGRQLQDFELIGTDPASPDYRIRMHYSDGSTQDLGPSVADVRTLTTFLHASGDALSSYFFERASGILSLTLSDGSVVRLKPSFLIQPLLTDEEVDWFDANKDGLGLAWRGADVNNDGTFDIEMWTSTGRQVLFKLP